MAKFIKFPIRNAEALTGGNGSRDILVNVDDIESVVDGAGAVTVVVTLKAGDGAGAQRAWTFTTATSVSTVAATLAANAPIVPAVALDMPFEDLCVTTGDRLGQDSRYWLDSSAIEKDVGWKPEIEWEEGLAEMVEWGQQHLEEIKDWSTEYVLRA